MKNSRKFPLSRLALLSLALFLPLVSGCNDEAGGKLTEQEKNDFKGGPMPAEAREKMQEHMEAARKSAPGNAPGAAHGPQ